MDLLHTSKTFKAITIIIITTTTNTTTTTTINTA